MLRSSFWRKVVYEPGRTPTPEFLSQRAHGPLKNFPLYGSKYYDQGPCIQFALSLLNYATKTMCMCIEKYNYGNNIVPQKVQCHLQLQLSCMQILTFPDRVDESRWVVVQNFNTALSCKMRFRGFDFGGSTSRHDTDKGELVANIKTRVQKLFSFCINNGNFVNNTKHCWSKSRVCFAYNILGIHILLVCIAFSFILVPQTRSLRGYNQFLLV